MHRGPLQGTTVPAAQPPAAFRPSLLKVWPEVGQTLRAHRTRAYELLPSLPGVIRLGQRQYRVIRDALRRRLEEAAP
ncbi:hypothetical protein U7230_08135 [Carboxydochorda subterranea]|uniref:Uncharacterized protein n=1 Tax=Carboxydichorda subterranea TaxID=3109565 RepID=A0ABZ1BV92_9FIRM|nr:hypothetical protein [Limnochorda sp. L945t]WRP16078.1 hypothetical protein U7230_08135 [Limnochorda sp. L945t]